MQTSGELHFQHRQRDAYLDALSRFRDEFAWIGFLDADEYLDLYPITDIHEYFSGIKDASAVAFNWACFGSNGHVVKPGGSTVECFLHRSAEDYWENRTIKSFVRPNKTEIKYNDPHRFFVQGRYIKSNGNDVDWHPEHQERINSNPDWVNGKLRHYAIRSAEHYIEKVKRRSDVRNNVDIGYFSWWDRNDVFDPPSETQIYGCETITYKIQDYILDEMYNSISVESIWPTWGVFEDNYNIYRINSKFNTIPAICFRNGTLTHVSEREIQSDEYDEVFALVLNSNKEFCFLISKNLNPIHIIGCDLVSEIVPFRLLQNGDGFCFESLLTRKKLSFRNDHDILENVKVVSCSVDWAQDWETCDFSEVDGKEFTQQSVLKHISSFVQVFYPQNYFNSSLNSKIMSKIFFSYLMTLNKEEYFSKISSMKLKNLPFIRGENSISF